MSVRIGVDFGTAFTKVAMRAGEDTILVDWFAVTGDDSPTGRYVVPGFVHRAPDGEFCWQRDTNAEVLGNLKLPIIQTTCSEGCPTATLAYLALVIRYSRAFLYHASEIKNKVSERSLRWELNIGCPTKPHENLEVVERLQRIVQTAWYLAKEEHLRERDIIAAWNQRDADVGLETQPGVVPEFVAQIASYLRSNKAVEGLHALIDIGAGTLDVATFNVMLPKTPDASPRIPIFFSEVCLLGTHYLSYNRYSRLGLGFEWDDAAAVETSDSFAKRNNIALSTVRRVDAKFQRDVSQRIHKVIKATYTNAKGYPNSPAWDGGLPTFITGGGAMCETYLQAIECSEESLRERMRGANLSGRFRFIEREPFEVVRPNADLIGARDRLTTAIGLTVDAENIARIVPHREIEPMTLNTRT